MFGCFGHFCNGFMNYGRFNFGGIAMMIIGVILIAAVIFFALKAYGNKNSDSPLNILEKRFVNGEINEEEYKQKKSTLKR